MTKLFDPKRDRKPAPAPGGGIFGLIVLSGFVWFFFLGGRGQIAQVARPYLQSWLSEELYLKLYPQETPKLPSPLSDPLVKSIINSGKQNQGVSPAAGASSSSGSNGSSSGAAGSGQPPDQYSQDGSP